MIFTVFLVRNYETIQIRLSENTILIAGPKRGRPCRGFSDPVCLSVCVSVCLAIKLQDLSLALRSHDQFEASHWMMDDG